MNAYEFRGVEDPDLYSAQSFDWKDGQASIPIYFVNDNFWDCNDGSDEPGTSACGNVEFYCKNPGFRGDYIATSKVDDGVCDCWDGSDENSGECPNACGKFLGDIDNLGNMFV